MRKVTSPQREQMGLSKDKRKKRKKSTRKKNIVHNETNVFLLCRQQKNNLSEDRGFPY